MIQGKKSTKISRFYLPKSLIPNFLLKKSMAFFLIYGARPICHLNRKEVEAGEHLGIIHKGYRGGAYNKRFEEEILKRGGYENVTVDDILEIRDILVKEFGIK